MNVFFSLLFAVPPGRPLIHNERGIMVQETLGPYNEGAELMLTCSVSGGEFVQMTISHTVNMEPTKGVSQLEIFLEEFS